MVANSSRPDSVEAGSAQALTPLESLAVRMHLARADVLRLKKARSLAVCERYKLYLDAVADMVNDGKSMAEMLQDSPCWRPDRIDEYGQAHSFMGGATRAEWCEPCQAAQKIHDQIPALVRRLTGLKSAFWRAAKRLAAKGPRP